MNMVSDPRELLVALFAPEARPDPYPLFHALREASPFALDEQAVVVGRYEHCADLLRDRRVSSDPVNAALTSVARESGVQSLLAFMSREDRSFVLRDPPDHTRLRGLVSRAFTPRAVEGLRSHIEQVVSGLLDNAADRGEIDVVSDFAFPLATAVISDLLGIPHEYRERFKAWVRPVFRISDVLETYLGLGRDQGEDPAAFASLREIRVYLRQLVAEKRQRPTGGDLLGQLVAVEESGDRLSEEELLSTAMALFTAGHGTAVRLVSNAILALLRNPSQLATLRDDPGLAPGAVEEVLRFDPPGQFLSHRTAVEPLIVGDRQVRVGSFIVLLLAAANRDPDVFSDPDRFDITRQGAAKHLAFAAGPHFCLGAGLGRLETALALSGFAERVVEPLLITPGIRYQQNVGSRGLAALPVRFRAILA